MTVQSKLRRARRHAAAALLAVTAAGIATGETRSEGFTLDQIARMGGPVSADEFPIVLGGRNTEIHLRFYEKRSFTIGDGSRHVMFLFRASNCWLRERTATRRRVIDCWGQNGPGVFIPFLVVTAESGPKVRRPSAPDLILGSRRTASLADFMPVQVLEAPGGDSRVAWIRLKNPELDSLNLSAPVVRAALVFCVPVARCMITDGAFLSNLDDTPPDPAPLRPPSSPSKTPPTGGTSSPPDGTPPPAGPLPPPQHLGQLRVVIRPAAGAMPRGWTPDRMAKRLLILVKTSRGEFVLRTQDGAEVHSSGSPELTESKDAVVAWSGDRPDGPAELIFYGGEGVELTSPRIQARDAVSFGEFRIATPFLYDQWQARIEIMTKVYGKDQADTVDDLCQFSLLIPRSGILSHVTGPISVGLDLKHESGSRFLTSQPVITPSQLMRAAGEPLHLDLRPTAADQGCASQTRKLASFTTASGTAAGAWTVSDMHDSPSIGRMEIRPSSLMMRGRWLLGLYGPQNIGAGDAQDQVIGSQVISSRIINSLIAFLDDLRERNFRRGPPESQAVGADLALIGGADAGDTTFSEKSVIVGQFRQPPASGPFQLDPEGRRRLSDFQSTRVSGATGVPFRTVGQTIRHYAQLFGELSGQKPPVAIYVGAARATPDACDEWRKMTAEVARLSGGPRVFGIVFVNAGSEQMERQLGQNSRGADEALTPETRSPTCADDGSPSLLFVSLPDLVARSPDAALRSAFSVLDGWASRGQN